MADRYKLIKQLRPIGIEFEPYGESILNISTAPKFWSDHRYAADMGYHYTICNNAENSITISLENICPKSCIKFEPATLSLNLFVEALQKSYNEDKNYISVPINIAYSLARCDNCLRENRACRILSSERPNTLYLKVYFSKKDISNALDYYKNYESYDEPKNDRAATSFFEPAVSSYSNPQNKANVEKENRTMENMLTSNLFGIKCGALNDHNICATLMGICFRSKTGGWIKFNPETRQRVDMGNIQIGNLGHLYLIPSQTVEVGNPILYEDEFYYVMDTEEWPKLSLLSVADGVEKTVYPSTNILGINFFSKVVSLINTDKLLGGDSDDLATVLLLTGGLNGNTAMTGEAGTNSAIQILLLAKVLGGGEGGLLDGLTDGGLFKGLGDDDNSFGKLLLLSGAFGGNANGQAAGGTDIPLLLLMSELNKKGKKATKKKSKNKPTDVEETAEPEPLTEEKIMQMIQKALNPEPDKVVEEAAEPEPLTEEKILQMIQAVVKKAQTPPAKSTTQKKTTTKRTTATKKKAVAKAPVKEAEKEATEKPEDNSEDNK